MFKSVIDFFIDEILEEYFECSVSRWELVVMVLNISRDVFLLVVELDILL